MSMLGFYNDDELFEYLRDKNLSDKKQEERKILIEKAKKYDKTYFENGVKEGISGYENYRWLPDLTIPMCKKIVKNLKIKEEHKILDYGCAKGFLVKALKEIGIKNVAGVDTSRYAIENCDSAVKDNVTLLDSDKKIEDQIDGNFDFLVCKDVLEHIPYEKIDEVLNSFYNISNTIFIAVPLGENGQYVVPEYEKDITHIIREDLWWWLEKIQAAKFKMIYYGYKFDGVKDNWSMFQKGNGFFMATKL